MDKQTAVILADAFLLVQKGILGILDRTGKITVSAQVTDEGELLEALRTERCDVLILDYSISKAERLDILPRLKKKHPALPVLVTSVHPGEKPAVRAFHLGADGYLWKGQPAAEYAEAVLALASGKKFISQTIAECLSFHPEYLRRGTAEDILSGREFQVMKFIASGLSLTGIAGELHLDIRTVGTYRNRVLVKMNLPTNAALIAYALKENIVH